MAEGDATPAEGNGSPDRDAAAHLALLDAVVDGMGGTPREGQRRMVREVVAAINGEEHLMVQAGTGTGKSLGYLVPLLLEAAEHGTRSLVSTATLALQRQILVKDAPAVVRAVEERTGVAPRVEILKGWSNYLCLRRLEGGLASDEDALFDLAEARLGRTSDLAAQVMRIREWARDTDTGDRDDLAPGVSDRAWRQVSVQRRQCPGRSCPMSEECFAQRARERASEADVVVTNHTLLGIHATGGGELLPEAEVVVVDEAHDLAERVRAQASCEISEAVVLRAARTAHARAKVDPAALEAAATSLALALDALPDALLTARPEALTRAVLTLDAAVRDALSRVGGSDVEGEDKQLARAALEEVLAALDAWSRPSEEMITWVARPWVDGEQGAPRLLLAPLDVAPAIGTVALGERAGILTSATLALGGRFEAMARDCGLMVSSVPWRGVDVGTPFDCARQGILYVADRLPVPGAGGPSEASLTELVDLVGASGGGALVLFSSWRGVEAGAAALRARTDLEILVQGEETLATLVARFREHRDSCLVGTLSLWQGVDVPGPACRLVVIDRIPFPRPDDPVAQARARDAERAGLSGFRAVHLTHAALHMAQGAGRLLRSVEDRGVVAVLDPRLVTKSYGAFVRASMPALWPTGDREVVLGALARLRADLGD